MTSLTRPTPAPERSEPGRPTPERSEPGRPTPGRPAPGRSEPEPAAPPAERGSATIWVAALTGLICLCSATAMTIGGIRSTRHQAQLAADMAALTAATRHTWGHPDPCPHARRTALKAGARLTTCTLTPAPTVPGTIAEVTVSIPLSVPRWLTPLSIPATARAGPASPPRP
ncbi:Rv3654c family TadE-like protein [Actinocorallia sp. B10E7]|uniref:Rv3654c family TadE-like protein n=1 Tax=Actinocorallia sp. B10E7 TaxID=3153558 RepID=UPI00325ED1E6